MKTIGLLIIIFTLIGKTFFGGQKREEEIIIFVPGLGDDKQFWLFESWWKKDGFEVLTFKTGWKSEESFENKLERLNKLIKEKSKNKKVVLIGTSAGGSLAINAYYKSPDKIKKVITVCSRLKQGELDGFRGFKARTKGYPTFAESIIKTEEIEKQLTQEDKKRIMTVRAMLGDELVPGNTATIDNATNITVPTMEHNISIALSLTVFSKPLAEFIEEKIIDVKSE
jgi:pimeloyl-ACP methyl ester carboxylesterase